LNLLVESGSLGSSIELNISKLFVIILIYESL
jgi:hypothetical protein